MQAELCSDLCVIGFFAIVFWVIAPSIAHRKAIKDPGMFLCASRGGSFSAGFKELLYEFHSIEWLEKGLLAAAIILTLAAISQIRFKSMGVSRR